MARSTFAGPVRSLRGFLGTGPDMVQEIGGSTVDGGTDVTGIDKYQGKLITVTNSVTVFNLPTINTSTTSNVSGPNDPNTANSVGLEYTFQLDGLATTNTFTLNAGTAAGRSTADVFQGMAWYSNSATDPAVVTAWAAGGTDTLTLDATTRGGLQGTTIYVRAAKGLQWEIQAFLNGNGTFVTPWS